MNFPYHSSHYMIDHKNHKKTRLKKDIGVGNFSATEEEDAISHKNDITKHKK